MPPTWSVIVAAAWFCHVNCPVPEIDCLNSSFSDSLPTRFCRFLGRKLHWRRPRTAADSRPIPTPGGGAWRLEAAGFPLRRLSDFQEGAHTSWKLLRSEHGQILRITGIAEIQRRLHADWDTSKIGSAAPKILPVGAMPRHIGTVRVGDPCTDSGADGTWQEGDDGFLYSSALRRGPPRWDSQHYPYLCTDTGQSISFFIGFSEIFDTTT
jgi:hypothetical protein